MQQQQRQMPTSQLLKRFIPYFYKYKKLLVIDLMAAGLTTVCELVLPLIVRRITNGARAIHWPDFTPGRAVYAAARHRRIGQLLHAVRRSRDGRAH